MSIEHERWKGKASELDQLRPFWFRKNFPCGQLKNTNRKNGTLYILHCAGMFRIPEAAAGGAIPLIWIVVRMSCELWSNNKSCMLFSAHFQSELLRSLVRLCRMSSVNGFCSFNVHFHDTHAQKTDNKSTTTDLFEGPLSLNLSRASNRSQKKTKQINRIRRTTIAMWDVMRFYWKQIKLKMNNGKSHQILFDGLKRHASKSAVEVDGWSKNHIVRCSLKLRNETIFIACFIQSSNIHHCSSQRNYFRFDLLFGECDVFAIKILRVSLFVRNLINAVSIQNKMRENREWVAHHRLTRCQKLRKSFSPRNSNGALIAHTLIMCQSDE